MGKTIRRSMGDTEPLEYQLRDIPFGEEASKPVNLTGKEVRITLVDGCSRVYSLDPKYVFANNSDRDSYFAANPTELVDGLLIIVTLGYQRWIGQWTTDYSMAVSDKVCEITDPAKGRIKYPFTREEVRFAGMYHVYFRVISSSGTPAVTTDARYPKSESLWIHIMDIFTE